jgi:hypothetical protein
VATLLKEKRKVSYLPFLFLPPFPLSFPFLLRTVKTDREREGELSIRGSRRKK